MKILFTAALMIVIVTPLIYAQEGQVRSCARTIFDEGYKKG